MTPAELKAARQTLGLSQAALADTLETTIRSISRYENGQPIPATVALAIEALLMKEKEK